MMYKLVRAVCNVGLMERGYREVAWVYGIWGRL